MDKIAVFPGSFDPITKGHESVIKRSLPLFDKIIIAIGDNQGKKHFFPIDKRIELLNIVFGNTKKIEIQTYSGLTVDFCKKNQVQYLIRGLRTSADFEFERRIAQMNKMMYPALETVFLLTTPELTAVHSSVVQDILKHHGDISLFVPECIVEQIKIMNNDE